MPTVPCPNCHRALNLPESLRGSEVQCPHCQTVFTAPAGEAVTPRPVLQPAGSSPTQGPSSDFDFPDEAASRRTERFGGRTTGPANWLRTAAIIEFLLSSCCFLFGCFSLFESPIPMPKDQAVVLAVVLLIGGTVQVGLAIVTLLGAGALASQNNYGLAMAGCITALVLGLKSLLQLAVAGLQLLGGLDRMNPAYLAASCGVFVVVLIAALGEWLGGIQGLIALSNDRVKSQFR